MNAQLAQLVLAACAEAEGLSDLLPRIHSALGTVMYVDNFYVAMFDVHTELYSFPFSQDEDDDDFTPQELRQSLTDYVRRTEQPILVSDQVHHALAAAGEVAEVVGTPSPVWLGAPLLASHHSALGVLVTQHYADADALGANDLQVLWGVARAIAPTVAYHWAYESEAAARQLREQTLVASRDEARRESRAKSSFLATMSHELRTPLNAIIGYTELLGEELEDADLDASSHVETILGAARHQLALINDVLDLSRIEAGGMQLDLEAFALSELLQEAERLSHPLAQKRCNQLVVLGEPGQLVSDRRRLLQCVMNLTSNACKVTEHGTVTIRARFRHDALLIEVADTGPGIPSDRLDALFEPFVQGDNRTTRRVGGTGLGLAITRELVQQLGGTVTARSRPGVGSTFALRLPVRGPDGAEGTP